MKTEGIPKYKGVPTAKYKDKPTNKPLKTLGANNAIYLFFMVIIVDSDKNVASTPKVKSNGSIGLAGVKKLATNVPIVRPIMTFLSKKTKINRISATLN